jgi:hypothetical protein
MWTNDHSPTDNCPLDRGGNQVDQFLLFRRVEILECLPSLVEVLSSSPDHRKCYNGQVRTATAPNSHPGKVCFRSPHAHGGEMHCQWP